PERWQEDPSKGRRPRPGEEPPPGWGRNRFPPERWDEGPQKGHGPRPGEEEHPERPRGQGERGGPPN
ncbi:MAG: hypothetical protein AAB578_03885, partial [Elusimicrobiota bacterium]